MAVKLADIAERAGVSLTTVSRVINGDKHISVSKDTEERIWKYVNELGYRQGKNADGSKKKAGKRVKSIGYVLTQTPESFSDDFFSKIIFGIEQELIRSRNNLAFAHNASDLTDPLLYSQMLATECDGLIILGRINDDLYDRLTDHFDNCVAVFTVREKHLIECISLDFEQLAYQMVSRMVECGHTNIAFIGGETGDMNPLDLHHFYAYEGRFRGYVKALMVHDLPIVPDIIKDGEWSIEGAYQRMKELLDSEHPVTCVFAAGDRMALGAMRAAQERGLRIPQDISIAGFDNIDITRFLTPPLCTVSYPKEEMGRLAVHKLLSMMSQREKGLETIPMLTLLPGEIVWRESVMTL